MRHVWARLMRAQAEYVRPVPEAPPRIQTLTRQILRYDDTIKALSAREIRRANVAYALLDQLDPDDPTAMMLLDRIYLKFPAGDENNHRTQANRMTEIDSVLRDVVAQHLQSRDIVRIHDTCCSNGVTSAELFTLLAQDREIACVASDLHVAIKVSQSAFGTTIWRDDGRCVQIVTRGRIWSAPFRNLKVLDRLKSVFIAKAGHVVRGWPFGARSDRTISLFHPKARALAHEDPRFSLMQHDIMAPMADKFDLIRILNVFHNWSQDNVDLAIRAACNGLDQGGILCVGFGQAGDALLYGKVPQNCSLFRRDGQRLVPLRDIDAPFPQKDRIAGLVLDG